MNDDDSTDDLSAFRAVVTGGCLGLMTLVAIAALVVSCSR